MKIVYSSDTDIGLVREINQDRCTETVCDWGYLFAVADGLGHHEGGQFASQTTVDLLKNEFSEKDPGNIPEFLKDTIEKANLIISNKRVQKFQNAMMGTTCVALVIQESYAYLAHAGDSRAYYLHGDELVQLTKDHSLVQRMVDAGLITEREAETHPQKNIVTEVVGSNLTVNADIRREPVKLDPGDKFLICSDGLWGLVRTEDLYNILIFEKPKIATRKFISLAKQNGGYDNITVQVIHIID